MFSVSISGMFFAGMLDSFDVLCKLNAEDFSEKEFSESLLK